MGNERFEEISRLSEIVNDINDEEQFKCALIQ
jgi:hypothetical protein